MLCMNFISWRKSRKRGIHHIISLKVSVIYDIICLHCLTRHIVINHLNNFTNITLSSLYFDITKDCLYANGVDSLERRAVITVLEQVHIFGML